MRRIITILLGLIISIASVGYVRNQARSTSPKDPLTRTSATIAIVESIPTAATALSQPRDLNLNFPVTSTLARTLINSAPKNDSDTDGDALTAQLVKAPSHGTLSLQPNGGFTYDWWLGAAPADSFTYRVSDGSTTSNTATACRSSDSGPQHMFCLVFSPFLCLRSFCVGGMRTNSKTEVCAP